MNPKHTLNEYADALARAGLLTASTLTPAAEGTVIDCLSYDTRSLHGTSLFLCKGAHFKAEYLSAALAQGAAAYVAEKPYPVDAPQLLVSDIRYAMVVLGQLFYDHVTGKLTSVGITGTKGKSTTAYYVRSILNDWLTSEGKPPCAILSSIDNYDGVITEESHITTPEVLELYQHFQNAYDSGISHLVMEVSSQALKVGRVRGMTFDVGAFLNIGTDHISPIEHPDFADYYASKLKLFDSCRVGCVNTDADHAAETVAHARSGGCELITFGSHASDTVFCERVEKRADGLYFTVRSPKYNGEFSITMPGLFNVSNALAAMAISMALGVPEEFVRSGLRKARANGRMQVYESRDKRVTVIVDYAHNRMSFDALYRSTRVEYPGKEMISVRLPRLARAPSPPRPRRAERRELRLRLHHGGGLRRGAVRADRRRHRKARQMPAPRLRGPRRMYPPRHSRPSRAARHPAHRQGRGDNHEARQRVRPLPERRGADSQISGRI